MTMPTIDPAALRALLAAANRPRGARLPWHLSERDPSTVYDADGAFVINCWFEDAALIVAAVNALPLLLDALAAAEARADLLERALSETVRRHVGYDWNADPDRITLLQGEAFSAKEAAPAPRPDVVH